MFYHRLILTLVICLTVFAALPTHADEGRYNQVSMQASAEREIDHDLMRVTLYSSGQDSDPARLAEQTTRAINEAIIKARQVSGVVIQSGSRTSSPVYDKDGQEIMGWRERAELHLESADFAALSALSSELLGELKMAGRDFLISKSRQKEIEDSLISEAITAFRQRAQLISQALGGKSYRLVTLNIDRRGEGGYPLQGRMQMLAPAPVSESVPQQIEAGSSDVTVTVSGIIEVEM